MISDSIQVGLHERPEWVVDRARAPNQRARTTACNESRTASPPQTQTPTRANNPMSQSHHENINEPTPNSRVEPSNENVPTHQNPLLNKPTQRLPAKNNKTTRGTLKIGTLNMRGGAAKVLSQDKWRHVDQLLKVNRIGILSIQEAHLTEEHIANLHRDFFGGIHILNTSDLENPSGCGGVAVVLNKRLTRWREATSRIIVPGRAILVELPWKDTTKVNILAVYAPNSTGENADFWTALEKEWSDNNLPQPDILLGDFNLVEETIDRMPVRSKDNHIALSNLATLKETLNLIDGWRQQYPNKLSFTYVQPIKNGERIPSRSRIDRIYVTESVLKHSFDWSIEETAIKTDHKMVVMTFSDPGNPFIGQGRWTIALTALKHKKLLLEVAEIGNKHLRRAEDLKEDERSPTLNAQTILAEFKKESTRHIRDYVRTAIPKLKKTIDKCKSQLDDVLNIEELSEEERINTASAIEVRIKELETLVHMTARDNLAAKHALQGETLSKYWINLNKTKPPRDTLYRLKKTSLAGEPPEYETRSDRMADIAKKHHENLQKQNLNDHIPKEQFNEVLNHLQPHLDEDAKQKMQAQITSMEIAEAMKGLPHGKAAGIDGIPYEFWVYPP